MANPFVYQPWGVGFKYMITDDYEEEDNMYEFEGEKYDTRLELKTAQLTYYQEELKKLDYKVDNLKRVVDRAGKDEDYCALLEEGR